MNFWKLDLGAWVKDTMPLSVLQVGVYLRLLNWVYLYERALPSDLKLVRRIVGAASRPERDALDLVLSMFFDLREDGWHNARADKEVFKAVSRTVQDGVKNGSRTGQGAVKAQSTEQLNCEGSIEHVLFANSAEQDAAGLNGHEAVSDPPSRGGVGAHPRNTDKTRQRTLSSESVSRDAGGSPARGAPAPDPPPPTDPPEPTPAGLACRAMRIAGLQATNPGDPRLLALLAAGVTADELAAMAAEGSARGKGWAWVLEATAGRRRDAQAMVVPNGPAPLTAAEAEVARWAPSIARHH